MKSLCSRLESAFSSCPCCSPRLSRLFWIVLLAAGLLVILFQLVASVVAAYYSEPGSDCMWRRTGQCGRTEPREPEYDLPCNLLIDNSISGFCDCNGNNKCDDNEFSFDCSKQEPVYCDVLCGSRTPAPPRVLQSVDDEETPIVAILGICVLAGLFQWWESRADGSECNICCSICCRDASETETETDEEDDVEAGLEPVLPSNWSGKAGVRVVNAPEMIAEIEKLMNDTWRVKYTRDRQFFPGEAGLPTGCRVLSVVRVEHYEAFKRYWNYKDRLAKVLEAEEVEPFKVLTDGRLSQLDSNVNEMYLFHGTSPAAADSISQTDFRLDMSGSSTGTMFGNGIYLAENASKSDEYAKPGEGIYAGLRAMLICRAVAGNVMTVKKASKVTDTAKDRGYHSVCGDRLEAVGTFREMVLLSADAVYAEYVAIYQRLYD
eukprot:TRINITY_DN17617_c0_g1_i1.p1 TRINITY_DN17617_c0_g1~~TRINITY_DN17617_c0_g1_i1.p1  ORF type:complete len:433 (-),score=50.03 TRINITY_DN17617_c0_g1_i1:62-1360(-)